MKGRKKPASKKHRAVHLEDTDLLILKCLLDDSRLSARKLSEKIGISTVTVLSRIKKMEESGTILGYSARINDRAVGYGLTAIIEISARNNKIASLESRLAAIPNVCSIYNITGKTDVLIIAKFRDRDELGRFLKKASDLAGVEQTETHVVLRTTKEDFGLA